MGEIMQVQKVILYSINPGTVPILEQIINLLAKQKIDYFLEQSTAERFEQLKAPVVNMDHETIDHDLVIVVGGDGSILKASNIFAPMNVPVLGINRGRLGFLVTHDPNDEKGLIDILSGDHQQEYRMMLDIKTKKNHYHALNECVITRRESGRLVEVDVFLNDRYLSSNSCDGLIVSTPTGSTGHALSAGGAIINPQVEALLILPMCPHKLTSRPIIVPQDSKITMKVSPENRIDPVLGCDGLDLEILKDDDTVSIQKSDWRLQLIYHPSYDYYRNLRSKLNWEEYSY